MNDKEKAKKWDEVLKKSAGGDDIIDIEGEKWVRMHPEMQNWADTHAEMIEWMTQAVKFPPRSDCG
jgi:hypothetical protein